MDPIAPIRSAVASRPLAQTTGEGVRSGMAGLTVQARVTKVDGDMVQLRLGNETITVPSRVPLTVGQQVNLMVEESSTGKVLLRIVDDGSGKGRSGRTESGGNGRGGSGAGGPLGAGGMPGPLAAGRELPVTGVQGRAERGPGGQSPRGQGANRQTGGQAFGGSGTAWDSPDAWITQASAQVRAGLAALEVPGVAGRPGGTDQSAGAGLPGASTPEESADSGAPGARSRADGGATAAGSGAAEASRRTPSFGAPYGNPIGPRAASLNGQSGAPAGWVAPGPATGQAVAPGASSLGLSTPTPAGQMAPGWAGHAPAAGQAPVAGQAPATGHLPASGQMPPAGRSPFGSWTPGQHFAARATPGGDPLAAILFEALDGSAARLAGTTHQRATHLLTGGAAARSEQAQSATSRFGSAPTAASGPPVPGQTPAGREHVARSALPAYGRLAQSVGGSLAFGQLMAALPREVGETLARAPLAPADLGRLLIDVGVHPDDMNAVLVGEMLSQGIPVQEKGVRALRRELAAAGGSTRDAAPAVALSRLGLPVTPLSLAVARQLLAGQLDPPSVWGELLPELQSLAHVAGNGSRAGRLASQLLHDWEVPIHESPDAVAQWLRAAMDRVGTPLEAKLLRALSPPPGDDKATAPGQPEAAPGLDRRVSLEPRDQDARPRPDLPGQDQATRLDLLAQIARGRLDLVAQDARARLDQLGQALPPPERREQDSLGQALQRTQATVQAEQILNSSTGSTTERTEPRFFAVTLPTIMNQQASTLQIRVRERDAQPRVPGQAARPDLVQLKLSLPGLGDLGVNLTIGQQSVACHFAAGSAFAEALLRAGAGELVDRLKQLGYPQAAVDAAHEPLELPAPLRSAAPRVSRVDLNA